VFGALAEFERDLIPEPHPCRAGGSPCPRQARRPPPSPR
jgi:hypothetical protein